MFEDYGLLGFVISQAEWNLLPGNQIAADAAANPPIIAGFAPMPTIPPRPDLPLANAAAGAVARFKALKDDRKSLLADLLALKQAILDGLDEKDMETITHPVTGTMNISHADIMASLNEVYGIVSPTDINRWRSSLADTIERDMTLAQRVNQHKKLVLLLSDAAAAVNEFDQIACFKASTATQPEVTACISRYEHDNPVASTRTFNALSIYLALHKPAVTTMGSLGYSNAATAITAATQEESPALLALAATVATALAAIQRLQSATPAARPPTRNAGRGRPGQAGRGRGAAGRGPFPANEKYCYLHGWCAHHGAACDKMAADMWRDGGRYTDRNVACKSHLDDPTGSKKNAPDA